MLGVTVVVVALAIALIGSWALSTEVNEVEVTTYNPIADITGLFESSQTPEYIEYNPSTNYTGYFTDESIVGGTVYFDGVDFTESSRANQYRVKTMPTQIYGGTVNLSDNTGTYPFDDEDHSVTVAYVQNGVTRSHINSSGTIVSLSSYISAMESEIAGANTFTLKSLANLDPSDFVFGEQSDVDWVLITTRSAWHESGGAYRAVVGTAEYIASMGLTPGGTAQDGRTLNLPFLSVSVDLDSNMATVYTDNDCQNAFGLYSLSDLILVYGGSASGRTYINFGDTANITASDVETFYMDPSKGVELS